MIDTDTSFTDVRTQIKASDGRLYVTRTQDIESYLDANKAEISDAPSWRPYANKNMRKVASIPMIVAEAWLKEGINVFDPSPDMQRKVAQKLNSNEYRHLRTYPGRVGYRA